MKLTRSADFAIRIVVYLAQEGRPHTMPNLASTLSVPYNNLSKLVQYLSKAGILQTKQGKKGGVQLLKSPSDISLKDIVDVIDGPTRLADCMSDPKACGLAQCCKLKPVLQGVQKKIEAVLDDVRIDHIVKG